MKSLFNFFSPALLIIMLFGCTTTDDRIVFDDSMLEKAVMEASQHDGDYLTGETSISLTELDASEQGIKSLAGIEALNSLEVLDVSYNEISDLSPLTSLKHLKLLYVMGNPLIYEEDEVIAELLENGVTVEYENSVVFDDTGSPSKGVFYKIEEGSNTVYLFGSIHVGIEELYPLHEDVESAFAKADYLAVEIDMTQINELEMSQYMSQQAMFTDGRSLRDVVNEDLFERALEITYPFGFGEDMLNLYKPWFVATLISNLAIMNAGYSEEFGIDNYFMDRADGKIEIIGLETVEDQLSVFNVLSMESQQEFLEETLEEYNNTAEEMDAMIEIWRTGDVEAFSIHREIDETASEDYQEFMRAMQDDRDVEMAEKIEDFLLSDSSETYFVVVGALHLVGETSIIGLLEQQGYNIQEGIQ